MRVLDSRAGMAFEADKIGFWRMVGFYLCSCRRASNLCFLLNDKLGQVS